MTDNLSDRERKLVEAVQYARNHSPRGSAFYEKLNDALRAYEPKRKGYTMPTWEEFTRPARTGGNDESGEYIFHGRGALYKHQYNAIRETLAKEEE